MTREHEPERPALEAVQRVSQLLAIPAHEQDERFVEHDLIAAHAERAETAEFRRNKERLLAEHPGCWVDVDTCDRQGPIEAHHIVEFSMAPKVDFARLQALLRRIDFYGYSATMQNEPLLTIDDIRNLVLLDDRCHRGVGLGIHQLSFPTWLARKAKRSGECITLEEAKLAAGAVGDLDLRRGGFEF